VLLGSQGVVNALLVNSLLLSLGAAGLSLVAAVLAFSRDERRLGYAAVGMVFAHGPNRRHLPRAVPPVLPPMSGRQALAPCEPRIAAARVAGRVLPRPPAARSPMEWVCPLPQGAT
jgi:hypothetical protein